MVAASVRQVHDDDLLCLMMLCWICPRRWAVGLVVVVQQAPILALDQRKMVVVVFQLVQLRVAFPLVFVTVVVVESIHISVEGVDQRASVLVCETPP